MWIFSVSAVYFSVRLSRVDSWRVILGGRILAYYMGVVGNTTWIVLLHRLNVSVFCFPKPFEIPTAEVKEVLTTLRSKFCAIFLDAMTESMNCEGKPRYLSLVAIVSTRFVSALHCWVTFWWLSNYLLIWLRFQLCFGQLSKIHPLIKTVMWLKAANNGWFLFLPQAVGQIHSPADPSVWDPLCCFRFSQWIHRRRL